MGQKVAIIGAGGIGFDGVEYLSQPCDAAHGRDAFCANGAWMPSYCARRFSGADGVTAGPAREIFLQRKSSKPGDNLGKTTGWIHRTALKTARCACWRGELSAHRRRRPGINVQRPGQMLPVDHVVICAGQEPCRELQSRRGGAGVPVHLIGGADVAAELDAKRAILQGLETAMAF